MNKVLQSHYKVSFTPEVSEEFMVPWPCSYPRKSMVTSLSMLRGLFSLVRSA